MVPQGGVVWRRSDRAELVCHRGRVIPVWQTLGCERAHSWGHNIGVPAGRGGWGAWVGGRGFVFGVACSAAPVRALRFGISLS